MSVHSAECILNKTTCKYPQESNTNMKQGGFWKICHKIWLRYLKKKNYRQKAFTFFSQA